MIRFTAALAAVASLVACGAKKWTNPVAEIRCGATTLRFEERVEDMGFPSGAIFFHPALLMNDGHGWKVVDDAGSHDSPAALSSFLPAGASLHVFQGAANRWDDRYHTPPWTLYVDPKAITLAEYAGVTSCIDANVDAIDAAWDRKRRPEENFDLSTERRRRVDSIVHIAYDRFHYPERVALGAIWDCPGGKFLRTETPDLVTLCSPDDMCGVIGRVSEDQKSIALYAWQDLIPFVQRITGTNYRAFYGTCRDSAGRSFYDALKPAN